MKNMHLPAKNGPKIGAFMKFERQEDGFVASYREMLAMMQHIYDRTGHPDYKAIIERANAQLSSGAARMIREAVGYKKGN